MNASSSTNTALLLVDIQNDYFPGGKGTLIGSLEAGEQAGRLLAHFRQVQLPIVFIQHIANRPGATSFLPGTPGSELHSSIQPLPSEIVFQKHYPNSFRETPLLDHLREKQISRLVVCGMMTHMCVDSTVRAAFDHGFECLIAGDACATRDLVYAGQTVPADCVQRSFLAALQGRFAKVASVDELLASFA